MHKRSILVIAPHIEPIDLPQKTIEIASIQRYHDAVVLSGTVRDSDIAAAIVEEEYEIIWVISHGSDEGITLSDGILTAQALIQYVRVNESRLCVLNTCQSEEIALQIAAESGADVICTIGDIGNADALRLGQLLAGELAFVSNYRDAFDIVAPSESDYRYYDAVDVNRGFPRRDDQYDELLKLYYKLDADMRVVRWNGFVLTVVVLALAYVMWLLYSKVGGM